MVIKRINPPLAAWYGVSVCVRFTTEGQEVSQRAGGSSGCNKTTQLIQGAKGSPSKCNIREASLRCFISHAETMHNRKLTSLSPSTQCHTLPAWQLLILWVSAQAACSNVPRLSGENVPDQMLLTARCDHSRPVDRADRVWGRCAAQ